MGFLEKVLYKLALTIIITAESQRKITFKALTCTYKPIARVNLCPANYRAVIAFDRRCCLAFSCLMEQEKYIILNDFSVSSYVRLLAIAYLVTFTAIS